MGDSRPAPIDIDGDSRQALELDAVLAVLSRYARTSAGAARVRELVPVTAPEVARRAQETVGEAIHHLRTRGGLVPSGLPDPAPALAALAVEGATVEARALHDLASAVAAGTDVAIAMRTLPEEEYPSLRSIARRVPDLRAEAAPVLAHVDVDGRIADDASPELRRLRTALAKAAERLQRQLESFLHDPAAASTIRDDFVTQRNGRFVIPVRTDAPRPVRGIVHASSSSGLTLFVEPLESVERNNELVRLGERAAEEEGRVLRGWADRFRLRLPEVVDALEILAEVDTFQAVGSWAVEADARPAEVEVDGPLRLEGARHPLLDRRLRERGGGAVPLDLVIEDDAPVLVLSGPNTGGKTVALKTVGLAALMAWSGIPVPAKRARIPRYDQVRADIGDHQSIQADLSTFSAHVRAVVRYLDEVRAPALVLFDEIGSGTDPGEGAALAQAVLERFVAAGVTTIATTHQSAIKSWAFTTGGAASAAMDFDEEALAPTFRVVQNAAGVSAGIDIASRLGMAPRTIDRARALLDPGQERAEAYLARLRRMTAEAERVRAELAAREGDLDRERERLERREAAEAERRTRDLDAAVERVVRELRERAAKEIAGLRDRKERAKLERQQAKAEARVRAEAERQRRRVVPVEAPLAPAGPFEPVEGARVRIRSLDRQGVVVSVRGDRVDVRMGTASFAVKRSDVEPAGRSAEPAPSRGSRLPAPRSPSSAADDLTGGGPELELLLLGKTVDEALPAVDKFLDDASRSGLSEVRVVHGHGTGRLRAAVREFLRGHPHVRSQRPGTEKEGGDGATVVALR